MTLSLGIVIICCWILSLNPIADLSISMMRSPSLSFSPFLLMPSFISDKVKWFSGDRKRFYAREKFTIISEMSKKSVS